MHLVGWLYHDQSLSFHDCQKCHAHVVCWVLMKVSINRKALPIYLVWAVSYHLHWFPSVLVFSMTIFQFSLSMLFGPSTSFKSEIWLWDPDHIGCALAYVIIIDNHLMLASFSSFYFVIGNSLMFETLQVECICCCRAHMGHSRWHPAGIVNGLSNELWC